MHITFYIVFGFFNGVSFFSQKGKTCKSKTNPSGAPFIKTAPVVGADGKEC